MSKENLKNYECVFREKGFFGGDQRLPEKEPLKYIDILKKYDKYSSDEQAADFLKAFSSEGCGYVALVNSIFLYFFGHEEAFRKTFGYDMYDEAGNMNFNQLALDFYCATDNHNRFLLFDYIDPYEDKPNKPGYGTTIETSKWRFERYMKKHGIHAKLMPFRIKVDDIEKRLKKGPIIVSVRPTILYDRNGNTIEETKGGHTMSVVGVSENGLVRVSSWGKEYYVKSGTYAQYEYYQQVFFRDSLEDDSDKVKKVSFLPDHEIKHPDMWTDLNIYEVPRFMGQLAEKYKMQFKVISDIETAMFNESCCLILGIDRADGVILRFSLLENGKRTEYQISNYIYRKFDAADREGIDLDRKHPSAKVKTDLAIIARGLDSKWSSFLEGDMSWLKDFKLKYGYDEYHCYIDERNRILDEIHNWQKCH